MADNTFVINQLATGTGTITISDDGSGTDWLVITGTYSSPTDITLKWTVNPSGTPTSASGFYFNQTGGHRLIVNGQIENVRGSNSSDNIIGNRLANILYGDQAATGAGGRDVIDADLGNDTVYGGSGNDVIGGDAGNDILYGDGGVDTINGGSGRDTILGGTGADVLSGGADNGDTVSYATSAAGVRINLTVGATTTGAGGDAAGDKIFAFTDVIGSSFNDVLTDTVKTAFSSGFNVNTFNGGNGNDTLNLGGGNDRGIGGNGMDTINGEAGDDFLFGDASTDSLYGAQGRDSLYGGIGPDRFIYKALSDSTVSSTARDTIADFKRTDGDKINLSAIDARSGTAANDAFLFIGGGAFTGASGQLRAQDSGAHLVLQADVNGDRVADFSILVLNTASLAASDFIL
jgi:Ca2+-binding RTX toxin-like protein